jgi:glycosyltransferase involved in cell wall biosynthesis
MSTIGSCLIVKNEHELLANCLDSLKGIDEIFIADTGSSDNTIEIAKQFTPHVYTEKKWEDDFAACRNFIKSKATTDWILSIDADEVLHDLGDLREAVALAEQRGALAVDVTMRASDNGQIFLFPRLFKNDPKVWWSGNIHNHLSVAGERLGNVWITHGYSPAHQLDPDRAFRILKKEVDSRPDAIREMFYLGREYFYRKDYENTVKTLGNYVLRSNYLAEKAEAFLIMSRSYWAMHRAEDARDAILQALKINSNFKEAIIWMSILAGKGTGNSKWEANAKQWENMASTADNTEVLFVRERFDFR